jgi:hypothetical protein
MDYEKKAEKLRAKAREKVGDIFQKIEKTGAIIKNTYAHYPICLKEKVLYWYVKEALKPEQMIIVKRHLAKCIHCATIVWFMRARDRFYDKSFAKSRGATHILLMGDKLPPYLMNQDKRTKSRSKT